MPSHGRSAAEEYIRGAERRFSKVSGIEEDLSIYPLHPHLDTSVETNKDKSKQFGEVFTPLWLVDEMIDQTDVHAGVSTLDLCAGYGQFSIRLLRKLYNQDPRNFNHNEFIKRTHSFSELQLSSCYKILRVFGPNINLFIGDSKELPSLPEVAYGVWVYLESMDRWVPVTKTADRIMRSAINTKDPEGKFVKLLQGVINDLNEGYQAMKDNAPNIRWNADTRLGTLAELDDALNQLHPKEETIRTPRQVVADMLSQVEDIDQKKILVMFNAEIVEELVHAKKVKPENITFGVDMINKARGVFVKNMYDVDTLFISKDPASLLLMLGQKKWDLVLSNPPYNRGLDLKILQVMLDAKMATEYVIVHPSTWLLDQKGKKDQYLTFKSSLKGKLRSVKLFNGYAAFKAEGLSICVITHIDTNYQRKSVKVSLFGDTFSVETIADITKFGSNWLKVVKTFHSKVEVACSSHGDVWSHNEKHILPGRIYCQLAAIIGHTSEDGTVAVKDDFYTLTMKDTQGNKGIRQPNLSRPGNPTPTFGFSVVTERDNFLSYINTDFARFCLALLKNSKNVAVGEMALIPWLDFTQSWDDAKLFAHFDIDQDTQDYIRSFLPDYYGIRKAVKAA